MTTETDQVTVPHLFMRTATHDHDLVFPRLIVLPDGTKSYFNEEEQRNDFALLRPYVDGEIKLFYEELDGTVYREMTIQLTDVRPTDKEENDISRYSIEYEVIDDGE
jgi:hypothetical protein